MTLSYQVLITPLVTPTSYGTVVDVTKDIDISELIKTAGLSTISAEIDQGDYDVGIYTYDSITLSAINYDGKFNTPDDDYRSIFPVTRDRAKVQINFLDNDSGTTIKFKGLIAEKATRQKLMDQTVTLKILSEDSIFQQVKVPAGAILDGATFIEAFQAMLNIPEITAVLNFDLADINPGLNYTIDDGSVFNTQIVKDALNDLLLASNSVLVVDSDSNIEVRSRDANSNTPHALYLYDEQNRDNIDTIEEYNTGLHRMFNSLVINDREAVNQESVNTYFVRQKSETLDFITSTDTSALIATALISEFGVPRKEMSVTMNTEDAADYVILDKVTVKKGLLLNKDTRGASGIYAVDNYGEAYYYVATGDIELNENVVYKIIGIFEDPATFKTRLKLRATGEVL